MATVLRHHDVEFSGILLGPHTRRNGDGMAGDGLGCGTWS